MAISYFNCYGISSLHGDLIITEQELFFKHDFPSIFKESMRVNDALEKKVDDYTIALSILSKNKPQQLVDSVWVQRKARQCIKVLFFLDKLLHKSKSAKKK